MFALAPLFTVLMAELTAFTETPGQGSVDPSRNTAMMNRVKSSFLRRSGVRNARRNAVSMRRPRIEGSRSGVLGPRQWRPDAV